MELKINKMLIEMMMKIFFVFILNGFMNKIGQKKIDFTMNKVNIFNVDVTM